MDASTAPPHYLRVCELAHVKTLDDCFGDFPMRVICRYGASGHIEPEAWRD
jgi:hypothetical protein